LEGRDAFLEEAKVARVCLALGLQRGSWIESGCVRCVGRWGCQMSGDRVAGVAGLGFWLRREEDRFWGGGGGG
jgi:hypothetical protein